MVKRLTLGFVLLVGSAACASAPPPPPAPPPPVAKAPEPAPEPKPEPAPAPPPVIEISSKIQFKTNSAELLNESKKVLDEVVKTMKDNPSYELVEIEGHTDSVGDSHQNLDLSQRRSESVRAYLMSQGIDGARLSAKGYGAEKPVADNTTTEGREQNRRVEFKIVKAAGGASAATESAAKQGG